MRMLMIFIDGFGIGENDPDKNPCIAADMRHYNELVRRYGIHATDACLDVPGLPQSATGQTTLYTGVNAAKAIGRHWSARPTQSLRDIIMEDNLFISLKREGFSVSFANVYTREYLDRMEQKPRGLFSPSVTTLLCLSSQTPFLLPEDYERGYGIAHDITGRKFGEHGCDIPLITPEQAAENLDRVRKEHDFTLFEFFMSDLSGHGGDMGKAIYELQLLDGMLGRLSERIDFTEDMLVIASDHGNVEDITVRTHTLNPVPTLLAGDRVNREDLAIRSLTDVKPAIMKLFKQSQRP